MELLVFLVLIFIMVLPVLFIVRTCNFFTEEFEVISVVMDMNIFRKIPTVMNERSRFLIFRDRYRFSDVDGLNTMPMKFLNANGWTNGGRYYITGDGFPERVGAFTLNGNIGRWRITLTPVVGKINIYRLR